MKGILPVVLAVIFAQSSQPAVAAWPTDPTVNLAITSIPYEHSSPQAVVDGAGGVIVVWQDLRSPDTWDDIYAQRVGHIGNVSWSAQGNGLCVGEDVQERPRAVADGAGGAIIVWVDWRSHTNADIFAQRVTHDGLSAWSANGIAVAAAFGDQVDAEISPDGTGGVFVVWTDYRAGNADIYAQRLSPDGTALWAADGVPICALASAQVEAQVITDGSGAAMVVWVDRRNVATGDDLYGQRLSSAGTSMWLSSGEALVTRTGNDNMQRLAQDGIGGAIIAWSSDVAGDIVMQRIDLNGNSLWGNEGQVVCAASGNQISPQILADGAGGAFVCWSDNRPGAAGIYSQRVNSSGITFWAIDGVAVTTAPNSQDRPQIVTDGGNGIILAWEDCRNAAFVPDIYSQRLDALGNSLWAADGVPVSLAPDWQWRPVLVSDGAGGAIIAWEDERVGEYDTHVYAQQIGPSGLLGDVSTDVRRSPPIASSRLSILPNPSTGQATFQFDVTEPNRATVEIFSVSGQLVFREALGNLGAGSRSYFFAGKRSNGHDLAAGIYICRVTVGNSPHVRKLVIVR